MPSQTVPKNASKTKKFTEWEVISAICLSAALAIALTSAVINHEESPVFYEDLAARCLATLGVHNPISVHCPGDECIVHTLNNFNGVRTLWHLDTSDCTVEDRFNF